MQEMISVTGKCIHSPLFQELLTTCRLCPHESPTTDVILLGHSLGGILAAEVTLLFSHTPNSNWLYQHRILGVIAFDTPFLGMHPRVVGTGIASLFRPTPEMPEPTFPSGQTSPNSATNGSLLSPSESVMSGLFSLPESDPNYNPSYSNDFRRPQRSKLENAWYFWNKHCGELKEATLSYVTSHFEFGGCLADYPGLKRRYEAIRALEDVDTLSSPYDNSGKLLRRVRFVNYYSASTGRIKSKEATNLAANTSAPKEVEMSDFGLQPSITSTTDATLIEKLSPSPKLSLEEHRDGAAIERRLNDLELEEDADDSDGLIQLSPRPGSPSSVASVPVPQTPIETTEQDPSDSSWIYNDLPPIPPVPIAPPEFDASKFMAKDVLKVAQKDYDRQIKAFERAKKDRERSIRDREKVVKKRKQTALKEQAKADKIAKQQETLERKEMLKRSAILNSEVHDDQLPQDATQGGMQREEQLHKKQKDRNFCMLPPKNRDGLRDITWIRVFMEGVDEVAAHTSLFFMSETYTKLVGDTATRIESWVNEDATKNALLAEE
jgi:hypothetical protein